MITFLGSGRRPKWKSQDASDQSVSRLKHRDVVGIVCQGQKGLGHYGNQRWRDANTKTRRDMIVQQIKDAGDEDRPLHFRGLYEQGEWVRWQGVMEKTTSCNDAWIMKDEKLRYIIRAVLRLNY